MESTPETQSSAKSYNDFIEENGLDPSKNHWPAFGEALQRHREATAETIGVTIDELHTMGHTAIQAALASALQQEQLTSVA